MPAGVYFAFKDPTLHKMPLLKKSLLSLCLSLLVLACQTKQRPAPQVHVVGAMKETMWSGQLQGKVLPDTIADREGLYGLGPNSYLRGELLLKEGRSYLSTVTSDSSMKVEENPAVSAPFFVYSRVSKWEELTLPEQVQDIPALQDFIDQQSRDLPRPFAFKLKGEVKAARIHIQNLPEGTKVSSPAEAHQGQVDYVLNDEAVEVIGFFSTEHQGVFTHHDSWLHMHLMTTDEQQMGHLDALQPGNMTLYLPVHTR